MPNPAGIGFSPRWPHFVEAGIVANPSRERCREVLVGLLDDLWELNLVERGEQP